MTEVLRSAGYKIESRHGGLPLGGIALLARLPEGLEDDEAVIDAAIEMGRFNAIPGSAFGAPGCIRFGYAGIPLEGIEWLAQGLSDVLGAVR